MYHIKEEKVEMRENEKLRRLERHRMSMVQSSLSMAARKLYLLLIQEPGLVSGMEEDVSSIHRQMLKCVRLFGNFRGNATEPLRDIAYDVEDFIDYLTLKSSTKRSRGVLCKKLEKIKVKIHTFLHRPIFKAAISNEIVEDQNIAQTVVSPVIKKVSDLLAQGSLRPQVKKKVRRMEDEFRLINGFLKNVETLEWDSNFMEWLEELCNVSCNAVSVINLFMINNRRSLEGNIKGGTVRRVITALPKLRSQLRLGMEMDRIGSRLKDVSEKMPPQVVDHSQSAQYCYNSSFGIWPERGSDEESDIVSFYDDVQEIMAQLLAGEKSSFAISISGMKGIGKTTLAKLVFENEIVVDHFPYRVWTSSNMPDIDFLKGILKQIDTKKSIPALWNEEDKSSSAEEEYKSMTGDEWEKKIRARQEKEEQEKEEFYSLFYSFLKDKKCLIVVDDIYDIRIINKLLTIFSDNNSGGSRMILILTDPSLISDLPKEGQGQGFLHLTLQLRDDNESWAMFTHILKVTIPPQLLISLRGDILKICCGLPLIIKRVADALSQKRPTMEEWSSVLQQFNGDQQFRSHILYDIDRCLPLHMRRCLFYFGLFPQTFDIPTRRLIALWIAEGLVYSEDETESSTLEDVARKYLTKLIGQCMVQVTKKKVNGEVQACRLPDPIRRQWYLKAKKATFLQLQTSSTSSEISLDTGMVRRLVDHLDEADSSFPYIHGDHQVNNASSSISLKARYKATSSFISFDTRNGISLPGDDITSFLRRCISSNCFLFLRVLDLERVYKPNLPVEVGKLTLLRYLGLRWTSSEFLPSSISKLLNLLTLDLKYTNISTLPSEIWKLQQLRHLYLSERDWSKFTHKPSSLTALQTLWGLFIDEKTPVKDGLDRLLNLRKLALKFRLSTASQQEAMVAQLEAVADWVLKLNHLQSLRLTSTDEDNQSWDLDLKPLSNHGKLSTVYLLGRLKNPSVISEFPNSLTVLTLSWSGLEEDPMQALDKLPNLRVLRLLGRSYIGKRMLCSSGGFPQLRILKLWRLEQLEEWNLEEGALRALRDLEIRSCRLLRMLPQELRHRAFLELKLTDMPDQFAAQD